MENLENDIKNFNDEIIKEAIQARNEHEEEKRRRGRPSNKEKKNIVIDKEMLSRLNLSYNQIKKVMPKQKMTEKQVESLKKAQQIRKENILKQKQLKEQEMKEKMKDKININLKQPKPRRKKEKEPEQEIETEDNDSEVSSDYETSDEEPKRRRPTYEKKKPKIKKEVDANLEALKLIDQALINTNPYLNKILESRRHK